MKTKKRMKKGQEYTDEEFKQLLKDNANIIFHLDGEFSPRYQYKTKEDKVLVVYGDESYGFTYIHFYGKMEKLIDFQEGNLVSKRHEKLKSIYSKLESKEKTAQNLYNAWDDGLSLSDEDEMKPVGKMGYTYDIIEEVKGMISP